MGLSNFQTQVPSLNSTTIKLFKWKGIKRNLYDHCLSILCFIVGRNFFTTFLTRISAYIITLMHRPQKWAFSIWLYLCICTFRFTTTTACLFAAALTSVSKSSPLTTWNDDTLSIVRKRGCPTVVTRLGHKGCLGNKEGQQTSGITFHPPVSILTYLLGRTKDKARAAFLRRAHLITIHILGDVLRLFPNRLPCILLYYKHYGCIKKVYLLRISKCCLFAFIYFLMENLLLFIIHKRYETMWH